MRILEEFYATVHMAVPDLDERLDVLNLVNLNEESLRERLLLDRPVCRVSRSLAPDKAPVARRR